MAAMHEQVSGANWDGSFQIAFRWWLITIFFISFQSCSQVILVNIFVMSIVDSYDMRADQLRIKCEEQIPKFQECWQEIDPGGYGIIDPYLLKKFIELLPPPLGLPSSKSPFEIEVAVNVLKNTEGYDYTFKKTLLIVTSTFMLQKKRDEARRKNQIALKYGRRMDLNFNMTIQDGVMACRVLKRAVMRYKSRKSKSQPNETPTRTQTIQ